MSNNAIKVSILDKEYLVSCPPEQEAALQASARHLSEKMAEIRASGKVVGIDRIAVMAGLNIANEAIEAGFALSDAPDSASARLKKLNNRIERALKEADIAGLN